MGHVFISYSRQDTQEVQTIAEQLEQSGLDVWIDRQDCQRQLEKDMASIRNAHGYVVGEAHASRGLGSWLMRLAASSALWLGTSFPNSTMML